MFHVKHVRDADGYRGFSIGPGSSADLGIPTLSQSVHPAGCAGTSISRSLGIPTPSHSSGDSSHRQRADG